MEKNEELHIGITADLRFPKSDLNLIQQEFEEGGLNVEVRQIDLFKPQASMVWAIPTFFAVWFFKPYTDGLLKEMAKDHYQLLKEKLIKIGQKIFTRNSLGIPGNLLPNKPEDADKQSRELSYLVQISQDCTVKFLFNERLSQEQLSIAIGKYYDLSMGYYADGTSDQLSRMLQGCMAKGMLFAIINPDIMEWELYDHQRMYKAAMEKQKNKDGIS